MWEEDLIRKLVVNAPHDLLEAIYARGLHREGPSWAEIVRWAQELGIFTAEEAMLCLKLAANREAAVIDSRSPTVVGKKYAMEDFMEQIEQGMSSMTELLDRYSREIRTISEEVLGMAPEASVDALRGKVAEVQDRLHREACQIHDRLLAENTRMEQELMAKITYLRETMQHVALLKEVVSLAVKPGGS